MHDQLVKILIIDGHTLFREGLRLILEADPGFEVCGDIACDDDAVTCVARQRPDVVLLDDDLPDDEAACTLRSILLCSPCSRVIMLSKHDDPRVVRSLLAGGACGYLLKSVTGHELVSTIRTIHADDTRIVLSLSRESLEMISRSAAGPLSSREEDVLFLVARALSNAQIAARLSITEGTVKRHLRNIFVKLGAVSRIDAVNKAVAESLIAPLTAHNGPAVRQ